MRNHFGAFLAFVTFARFPRIFSNFIPQFTIFVSVISASEIVHEADPHVKDQNIELEYDELVSDIRKHIQAAPLNDLDTTCNNICNLLETDANVDGKQLRAFKPFCDEKCPDLLIEAQNLNTDEKFPLQDSTLSDFIIDVLKRHDEL